jgi:hypothetical protein
MLTALEVVLYSFEESSEYRIVIAKPGPEAAKFRSERR